MYYENKVVFITGASSGIGKEMAVQLAKQKAKLVLTARRADVLAEVQQLCLQYTSHCDTIVFDLSKTDQIGQLATEALAKHGYIDVLVNNAGVSQRSLTIDTDISVDRRIMELDYFATITLTKALLPQFVQRGHGHIIVISSVSGLMGFPMRSAYAAAKHALHGFFETLQTEKPAEKLYVTIACPGRVNTPISMSALTGDGKPHQVMDDGQKNGIPVDTCVRKILTAAQNGKRLIKIARAEGLLLFIKRIAPGLFFKIAHKKGMQPH
ncbi:SDR family oxidoreductase [Terrimonas rubra]|uniref:SDR family oxidoreductase n=1 Tax=Terrimonas rubra TaxID=1035890 RepID=A0ABW6A8Y3_9BACT